MVVVDKGFYPGIQKRKKQHRGGETVSTGITEA